MRILIQCARSQRFFNGDTFTRSRATAHDFKNVRAAVNKVRDQRWTGTDIVLAYADRTQDIAVSTESMCLPADLAYRQHWRK